VKRVGDERGLVGETLKKRVERERKKGGDRGRERAKDGDEAWQLA